MLYSVDDDECETESLHLRRGNINVHRDLDVGSIFQFIHFGPYFRRAVKIIPVTRIQVCTLSRRKYLKQIRIGIEMK